MSIFDVDFFFFFFLLLNLRKQIASIFCLTLLPTVRRCDFSGSHEAGAALAEMLKLGSSVPWQDALETLTGERKMDAGPILEFFRPLHKWLQRKNRENGDRPGWQGDLV